MSIHELSVKWAAYLARELESDRIQENRMAFGLELLLGEIVKLALVITISYLLGILPEVLTITLVAGFLRLASGGEHCSAYYRCLIGGLSCFILLGWTAHLINPLINNSVLWLVICIGSFISGAILWQYAPGDTANKPINTLEQKKLFRKWSFIILGVYICIMVAMMQIPAARLLVLPMLIGILEQSFTISPWGYNFIHSIDRLLGSAA